MPFPSIGGPELVVILIIALIVLGPGKLPDAGKALGKSVAEFRKAVNDVRDAGSVEPTAGAGSSAPAAAAPATPAPDATPADPSVASTAPAPSGDASPNPSA